MRGDRGEAEDEVPKGCEKHLAEQEGKGQVDVVAYLPSMPSPLHLPRSSSYFQQLEREGQDYTRPCD